MNQLFIVIINLLLIANSFGELVVQNKQNNEKAVGDKVKVTIFYDNLNRVNRKFFIEEFWPVFNDLWPIVDLELVPYGNTIKDGDDFKCHFGEKQCLANKVQSCAIGIVINEEDLSDEKRKGLAKLVYCMFKNREMLKIEELSTNCVNQNLNDKWISINQCIINKDYKLYFNQNKEKTDKIVNQLINGLAVQIGNEIKSEYTSDLVKAICSAYEPSLEKPKPKVCEVPKVPKIQFVLYYETLNINARNYFDHQLQPYYHILEDIVDIDLVPYGNTKYNESTDNKYSCDSKNQCVANKIHALVITDYLIDPPNGQEIDGAIRAINFIDCMQTNKQWQNIYISGEQCAKNYLPINTWTQLLQRALGPDGDKAYETMKNKTNILKDKPNDSLPRIPMATINGEKNIQSVNDFVQQICTNYNSIKKPAVCTRLDVVVYYESLHHKSRRFLIEQLKPTFNVFQNLINLKLIPSGTTKIKPPHDLNCTYGISQCNGNKIQACIIDDYWINNESDLDHPMRQEVMDFIYCFAKNKQAVPVLTAGEQCSETTIQVNPRPNINDCVINRGNDILMKFINETQNSGLAITQLTLPVITINNVKRDDAKQDLLKVLCEHFDEDVVHRPDLCDVGKASKINISVYYESMSLLSKTFFTKQFGPNFKHIEEMVNIEIVPNGNVKDGIQFDGKCATRQSACMANKIQAIVEDLYWLSDYNGDQIDGSIRTVNFLKCVFSHPEWKSDNYIKVGEFCADNYLPLDMWTEINIELNMALGDTKYMKVQQKTQQIKDKLGVQTLQPIPYVTLNGKHSLRTANDLLQTVCAEYKGEKPLECESVMIEIYYETLNPQTRKFFLQQLRYTFEDIRESFTLHLIPYGRTNSSVDESGNTVFDCLGGPQQCLGNKIQGCAISRFLHSDENPESTEYDGKNQTLLLIHCMFKNVDNQEIAIVAKECADKYFIGDVWNDIYTCALSEEGDQIMKAMETKTKNLKDPLQHTPWIIINGERSPTAQTQLHQLICSKVLGDIPESCETPRPEKVKIDFHYQTGDLAVKNFVVNELYPSYRDIEEIFELEIIPFGRTEVYKGKDDNYTFICPNGNQECNGNKIHACIYELFWHNDDDPISDNLAYDGKLQTLEFINCYFNSQYWPMDSFKASKTCVDNNFAANSWHKIVKCVEEADSVFAKLANRVSALSPPLRYTPWIIVNGKHSKASEIHLTRSVCDTFEGNVKPWACDAPIPPITKINIQLHYEPLNSNLKNFIFTQFDHLKTHLDELAVLDIIPFGTAVKNDDNTFQCPGNDDCHTYKHHACVMNLFLQIKPIETLNFLVCTFGDNMNNVPKVTQDCANRYFTDQWMDIDICARNKGNQLLAELADKVLSLNPKLTHVPWILIEGEHNMDAEENLIQEICDIYYPSDKPSVCIPELLSVAINYQTLDTSVADFFNNQLKEYLQYVNELAFIEFLPFGLTERVGSELKCSQEVQCKANKVHACVFHNFYEKQNHSNELDLEDSRYRTLEFLNCTFDKNSDNPVNDGQNCVQEKIGDYWTSLIDPCANGPDGSKYYEQLATKTAKLDPPLTKVPWVTINNKYTIEAETSLIHVICDSYPFARPAVCSSLGRDQVDLGVYYSSNDAIREWVVNQLTQFYTDSTPTRIKSLEQIVSTVFIPWGQTIYNEADNENPFICNTHNECFANRIQACIIDRHENQPKGLQRITEFIICFFSKGDLWKTNPGEVGNQCANIILGIDPWPTILSCARGNKPADIYAYLKMRDRNTRINPTKYPWITVKGDNSNNAVTNLLDTVCSSYSGILPDRCTKPTPPPPPPPPPSTTPISITTPPVPTTTDSAISVTMANCFIIIMSLFLFVMIST